MIDAAEIRGTVIRPALQAIKLWSPAAEDVLFGTGLQESGYRFTRQLGGGPALSWWQIEPATHQDIWTNFLAYRPALARDVAGLLEEEGGTKLDQLEHNPRYACAIARLKYYRSPVPLPAYGDVAGYALLWKRVYNTAGGAGTAEEFAANWQAVMGGATAAPTV